MASSDELGKCCVTIATSTIKDTSLANRDCLGGGSSSSLALTWKSGSSSTILFSGLLSARFASILSVDEG